MNIILKIPSRTKEIVGNKVKPWHSERSRPKKFDKKYNKIYPYRADDNKMPSLQANDRLMISNLKMSFIIWKMSHEA